MGGESNGMDGGSVADAGGVGTPISGGDEIYDLRFTRGGRNLGGGVEGGLVLTQSRRDAKAQRKEKTIFLQDLRDGEKL
jgi:hypothetical protein